LNGSNRRRPKTTPHIYVATHPTKQKQPQKPPPPTRGGGGNPNTTRLRPAGGGAKGQIHKASRTAPFSSNFTPPPPAAVTVEHEKAGNAGHRAIFANRHGWAMRSALPPPPPVAGGGGGGPIFHGRETKTKPESNTASDGNSRKSRTIKTGTTFIAGDKVSDALRQGQLLEARSGTSPHPPTPRSVRGDPTASLDSER